MVLDGETLIERNESLLVEETHPSIRKNAIKILPEQDELDSTSKIAIFDDTEADRVSHTSVEGLNLIDRC